jgi:hypothetical protein
MMKTVQTIVDRIKTPPNGGTVSRKFWFILGALFALAFVYEAVRWSRGGGEPDLVAFTAGFLSMSAFFLSTGGWMRVVFFVCGMGLLMISFVMRFVHLA